mgnify:CR=1 FL=1|jgi:hypothetical protein
MIKILLERLIRPKKISQSDYFDRYQELVGVLDNLQGQLGIKEVCGTQCHSSGCCGRSDTYSFYAPWNFVPRQLAEAEENGWSPPQEKRRTTCDLHRENGCSISSTKSPYCLGYLCKDKVESYLMREYGTHAIQFINDMGSVFSSNIGEPGLLDFLEAAIESGERILENRK